MKIFQGISEFTPPDFPVVTLGTFDGVHTGHQNLVSRLTQLAREKDGESVLLTFWPHPRRVIDKNDSVKLLNTIEEKADLLKEAGLDNLVVEQFTPAFSQQSPEAFVQNILVSGIGTRYLVIGYDHHFGKDRAGDIQFLKANADRFGFEVEEIPAHEIEQMAVSSTKIRNMLGQGQVREAERLLGHPYLLSGYVVPGHNRGHRIGFPTANVEIDESAKLIPAEGVYAVQVSLDGVVWDAMANIGGKPTFGEHEKGLEVYLFGFRGNLYDQKLRVSLRQRIRGVRKFPSVEALKTQLQFDQARCMSFLRNLPTEERRPLG